HTCLYLQHSISIRHPTHCLYGVLNQIRNYMMQLALMSLDQWKVRRKFGMGCYATSNNSARADRKPDKYSATIRAALSRSSGWIRLVKVYIRPGGYTGG